MAKFCTNCGKPIEEGEAYCGFCGQSTTGKPTQTNTIAPTNTTKTNDLAIVGIVISIAVSAIIGIVLCAISLGQIKKNGEKGKEIAIAGIVIGVIKIAVAILWFMFAIFVAITDSSTDYEEYDFSTNNAIVEIINY